MLTSDYMLVTSNVNQVNTSHASCFQVYPMRRRVRGRAIIVNIETFDRSAGLSDRQGSLFDVVNLMELFKHLHFDTTEWKNLTGKVGGLYFFQHKYT